MFFSVAPANGQWLESFDPYRGTAWAKIARGTAPDAQRAVAAAHDAMYRGPWSRMTPSERAAKTFELSDMAKRLFREGLRHRFPEASEAELHRLFLQGLAKCHNQNY